MIKLIHAADFHLDSAFSSLSPEQARSRRQEQRLALQSFAKLCEGCDLVLLSGDLFDSARIYRDTLDALKECFAAIDAEIFIAPGNHDHLTGGSPYLTEFWGDHVHIFKTTTIERVRLDKLGCDIYGAAFLSQEQAPMLQNFRVYDPNMTNLMVLHADLQPNSSYGPIRTDEIGASGLDYLALGHIHQRSNQKIAATTYAYPGCLMGRGFDECGQKGVLRVSVEPHRCEVEFLPLFTRKYEILSVEIGENALDSIRNALPNDHKNDCYRIILTGESDAIDVNALQQALGSEFYSLSIIDKTLPKRELWSCITEDTLRGHCLRDLKAQYDTAEDPQLVANAARLLLSILDGREVGL